MEKVSGTVIVKPVNASCNMACSYCYMNKIKKDYKSDLRVMSEKTLERTIDFFCSDQKFVEFIWHGGEPLLAGRKFYKKVFELQKKYNTNIKNFLQTNATLIDKDWVSLLKDIDFSVGVSLDSPLETHDLHRVDRLGKPTSRKVLDSIELLQEKKIFSGVICCISRDNYKDPDKILRTFLDLKIKSIKFLRVRDSPNSISLMEFNDFLFKIFNIWLEINDPELDIRDIKSVVNVMLGGSFRECSMLGDCARFLTVYCDGKIFPCDNFLDSKPFGSVFDSRNSIFKGKEFIQFSNWLEKINSDCPKCEWFYLCKGGCSNYKMEKDSLYCESRKIFFKNIFEVLNNFNLI